MTQKKAYIHLGFQKTGSSSFQATCKENVEYLEKELDIIYPLFNLIGNRRVNKIDNHSFPLESCYAERPEKYYMNKLWKVTDVKKANEHYLDYLRECLSKDKDIIFSGEGISNMTVKGLTRFTQLIRSYGYQIIPMALVRSPYDYHCSFAQQMVKGGRYFNFTKLKSQKSKVIKVKDFFKEEMQFYPFAEACKHAQGPTGFLCELMGIDVNKLKVLRTNEGVSNEFVRVQNVINEIQPRWVGGEINPNFHKLDMTRGSEKFYLTEKEYRSIFLEALRAENKFFERALGIDFCNQKIRFANDVSFKKAINIFPELLEM